MRLPYLVQDDDDGENQDHYMLNYRYQSCSALEKLVQSVLSFFRRSDTAASSTPPGGDDKQSSGQSS